MKNLHLSWGILVMPQCLIFFGLGHPGPAPFQPKNNNEHEHNQNDAWDAWPQVDQDENEVVQEVPGLAFDLNMEPEAEVAIPDLNMDAELPDPGQMGAVSMEIDSFNPTEESDATVSQEVVQVPSPENALVVLALPIEPGNILHHELELHELNVTET
jgi:hypothetical protein